MSFPGFTADDFEVFSIPDFAGRMAAIRARIRPKLEALSEDLLPRLEEDVVNPLFPRVAQHMRRRVNPPVETWVAFGRDKKGYKRWTHYRVAINGTGVRVTVFIEDDADDKAPFGAQLVKHSTKLRKELAAAAGLQWYTFRGGEGAAGGKVTLDELKSEGAALQRLKTVKFQAGIPLAADRVQAMSPDEFEAWALEQAVLLRPLYLAGVTGA